LLWSHPTHNTKSDTLVENLFYVFDVRHIQWGTNMVDDAKEKAPAKMFMHERYELPEKLVVA
jgi:hypothetical protein